MTAPQTIFRTLARKSAICFALIAVGFLTFASKGGGGGDKDKKVPVTNHFTPIRTTNGFTLKSGPVYRGSQLFSQQKKNDVVTFKGHFHFHSFFQEFKRVAKKISGNRNLFE